MWGQTIFPGSLPFKSYVYICCIIYLFCNFLLFCIVYRKKKSFLFLPKGRAFVTIQNGWNNRISVGCVYAQIRRGLGMHLVTYSNHAPGTLSIDSPNKRSVCLRWNSLCLYLSTLARFPYSC